MRPPQIGDCVRVKADDINRFNDYLADLSACLSDRDITPSEANKIEAAMRNGKPFMVTAANPEDDSYELAVSGTPVPWCFNLEDLIL